MTEIYIPFLPQFEKPMLESRKTLTTRSKKYGSPGDTFEIFGARFRLLEVRKDLLLNSCRQYLAEGFRNSTAFICCWNKLHPRKGYQPGETKWLHYFEIVVPENSSEVKKNGK